MRLAVAESIVPFIFIYTPDLLITSGVNVAATIFSFFVTGVGLLFLCAAVEGALLAPVRPYTRVLFAVIALLLILAQRSRFPDPCSGYGSQPCRLRQD